MSVLSQTTDLLGDLIAFPTVSLDSNLDMIRYIAKYLDALGARVDVLPNPTGTKANLFATLGPEGNGGILLSGHSDVVPVADQDWSNNPFEMQARDGWLYGRGSCDMKGFMQRPWRWPRSMPAKRCSGRCILPSPMMKKLVVLVVRRW